MALFRSTLPLRTALALSQAGERGLSLREIARALTVRDSSAQHAVQVLREEGVAIVPAGARPRYVLGRGDAPRELLRLAARHLPLQDALAALVGANRAVEFAAYRDAEATLYAVYAEDAEPADELLLSAGLVLLPSVRLIAARHDLFIEAALRDPSLRERVLGGRILKGSVARSLPDRTRHGDFRRARRLGRPHPRFGGSPRGASESWRGDTACRRSACSARRSGGTSARTAMSMSSSATRRGCDHRSPSGSRSSTSSSGCSSATWTSWTRRSCARSCARGSRPKR